jgi:pyruvate/2-oxoglutarate dehydrogenase complex dihydrolipoamide dehydrogenase (E3) component
MIASARVAHLARRAADYGVHTGEVTINLAEVRERKRAIVESFRSGSENSLRKLENVTLLMGTANFTGLRRIRVETADSVEELSADKIFINVGTRPVSPPIEGLSEVPALDSTSIMELDEVPEKLLVLGGGYIGLEFAQMFRRFGSEVTVVQRGPQLLGREDTDVAEAVAGILADDGVELHLGAEAVAVRQDDRGSILLTIKSAEGEQTVEGTHLLVATGRRPNSDTLNLEATGLRADKRGFIEVNGKLETSVPGIYALGDVKGGPAFTHISYDDYRIVRDNLLQGRQRTTNERLVPYTVFIDPQLGRVGLGEEEARAWGYKVKVAKLPMSRVARALETDETRGFMKAVVEAETGQILGATILGLEGGEIVSVLQMAMMGRVPYTVIRDSAFAHPTLAESLNNLFMTLD